MFDKVYETLMNWEETIQFIRSKPEYTELIELAYFDENLPLNVERFMKSVEFQETLSLVRKYCTDCRKILDVGSGNGISAVAFALQSFDVLSVEPDSSNTIGAGAIRRLKEFYNLKNLEVQEAFAEELKLPVRSFDLVYSRQCMHHAYDLEKFIAELSRVLKPGGILLTVRDHVVFDEQDKKRFLQSHPLHKFYGGENAFSPAEYKSAMNKAGLTIKEELKYFDSAINYFPLTKEEIKDFPAKIENDLQRSLKRKIGRLGDIPFVFSLFKRKHGVKTGEYNERLVPGRMYSYVAQKL